MITPAQARPSRKRLSKRLSKLPRESNRSRRDVQSSEIQPGIQEGPSSYGGGKENDQTLEEAGGIAQVGYLIGTSSQPTEDWSLTATSTG
ncbi:MAG: hypothetical protein R3E86_00980 [Pseudomonadales bacterium]